jgi:hypothetical protein
LLVSSLANAQDSRTRTRVQVLPPAMAQPSGADLVNKLLNPGPSDPNVPLPQPGLDQQTAQGPAEHGATVYGRKEENGALLGVRVPLPGDRASTASH